AAGERRRVSAHFRAALHAGVAANGHESALVTADVTFEQAEVQNHGHSITTEGVLGYAHAPDQHRRFGGANQFCKLAHTALRPTGFFLEAGPILFDDLRFEFEKTGGVVFDEGRVVPAVFENDFQHAVEKGDVAALGDGKPVIHDIRAKQRA